MASIVDQETDVRFWASTGYKPGQKLDPKDPNDQKMIPVWIDTRAKVNREFMAGTLVTTFDKSTVVQNIEDAHVADAAARDHLDEAAKATDPATAKLHTEVAAEASNFAAKKLKEVANQQPPSVSPQLTQEASQAAAQEPPPPGAPAKDHIANVQAQAAHKPSPRGVLDRETDARFWAQTHYRPGQKLDPSNPQDAKMARVWLGIYRKVKREDDAGQLVLTYNHPIVAQNLADAQVADQVAATQLDAAATTTDPWGAQQSVAAATAASQIAEQKTHEAATMQPPSVSPELAHEASPERALIQETYAWFWRTTRYKPGKLLDPQDPQDAKMIPVWTKIFEQVQHAHFAGKSPTGRDHLAEEQARRAGQRAEAVHRHHVRHRHQVRSTVHPRRMKDFREGAVRAARSAGAQYVLVYVGPDGRPSVHPFGTRAELDAEYAKISDEHGQYQYVASFDLASNSSAPIHDSVGVPAAEHAEMPSPTTPAAESSTAMEQSPPAPSPEVPAPSESKWSIGKILAIAAGVLVVGGIVYAATRKSSETTSRSPRRFPRPTAVIPQAAVPAAGES